MRQPSPRPRVEPVDEGMSGLLRCIDALRKILSVLWDVLRYIDVGEPFLPVVGIAVVVVRMVREVILLILPTRFGDEQGIIEGLLGMCMAKLCGCRSGRGLRAHGPTVRNKQVNQSWGRRLTCLLVTPLSLNCSLIISVLRQLNCNLINRLIRLDA